MGFTWEHDNITLTYLCSYRYTPEFLTHIPREQLNQIKDLQESSLESNQLLALAMIAAVIEKQKERIEEREKREKYWHCLPGCCSDPDPNVCTKNADKDGWKKAPCNCLCHPENLKRTKPGNFGETKARLKDKEPFCNCTLADSRQCFLGRWPNSKSGTCVCPCHHA